MKKQILLLVLMIFSGLFIASVKENGVKACASNAAAGLSMKKCSMMKVQQQSVEDIDASFNMFMNPFDRP